MKKGKTSKLMLVFICAMIILYTIASFLLQWFTGYEISSQLTLSYFGFFAIELINLAAIKTSKVKHNYNSKEEEEIED